jgi:hypothetical protein
MRKIISLFKRDYNGTGLVYDEIVPGAEWVAAGEGKATLKVDGTCCMVRGGNLYKRYDHKPDNWKAIQRAKKYGNAVPEPVMSSTPDGFEPAQGPDPVTLHWPGWLPVRRQNPEDRWHIEAFGGDDFEAGGWLPDGTYELIGPKVQSNPYGVEYHQLCTHGAVELNAPRMFGELKEWFKTHPIEGVVWHHPDGRMVKIKRRDFGLPWPITTAAEPID